MISTESLSKKYGDKFVLREVSATLPENKITAFIGCNGAGKSTMLNIISRLIPASEGCAFVDGKKVSEWDSRKLAQNLAILGQNSHNSARISVEELVAFGRFPHSGGSLAERDFEMVERALKITGIEDLRGRFIDELSGGQRQSLTLFMAVIANPKLLLLDEHTAALDPAAAEKVLELTNLFAAREGMCTLMITHNMKDALRYGNKTILMKSGRVAMELVGEERAAMTVERLIEKFSIDNDRMLL